MKTLIKNFLNKSVRKIYDFCLRDNSNVDIVLSQILEQNQEPYPIHFPSAYVELLRDCIEKKVYEIREIKTTKMADSNALFLKRFSTLLEILPNNVPAIEFKTAKQIALIADSYRLISKPYEQELWAADVHTHFHLSSSFGTKGRILNTIVRVMRSEKCLELGTAYGMSALFIIEALKSIGEASHLTTVEGLELQFLLASKMLNTRYGDQVSCHLGLTEEVLPKLVKSLGKIDFMFHDAAHSKEDYIRDFNLVIPILVPGSVVLIDDIRWDAGRFSTTKTRCYEGWMEIVSHPRVLRAVEINNLVGLLLLGS
ncbi:MAG: O-methyltransferase [Brasilonema sp.]